MVENFVISLVNRKGGVSKTTSAAYIAMCLHLAGNKVTAIDLDPDESLDKWHEAITFPFNVKTANKNNLKDIVKGLEGYVVIDTPPNDGEIIYVVSAISDEVIIPMAATGLDINRLATTLSGVSTIEEMRGKPLASVLLTRWRDNVNIGKESLEKLAAENVPVIDQRIRFLTRYEGFGMPEYLEEYQAVLKELEIL